MARPKATGPSARNDDIRVRIPSRLKEKLRAISEARFLSMSDVAIEAIVTLLNRYDDSGAALTIAEDEPQDRAKEPANAVTRAVKAAQKKKRQAASNKADAA